MPDVRLYYNGSLVTDMRAKVRDEDGKVTATISKASTEDGGSWQLEAKNAHGTAKDDFKITVRGVPGPVRRLDVKDVDKTEMTITWQEPDCDGGSAITGWVKKRFFRVWQYLGLRKTL